MECLRLKWWQQLCRVYCTGFHVQQLELRLLTLRSYTTRLTVLTKTTWDCSMACTRASWSSMRTKITPVWCFATSRSRRLSATSFPKRVQANSFQSPSSSDGSVLKSLNPLKLLTAQPLRNQKSWTKWWMKATILTLALNKSSLARKTNRSRKAASMVWIMNWVTPTTWRISTPRSELRASNFKKKKLPRFTSMISLTRWKLYRLRTRSCNRKRQIIILRARESMPSPVSLEILYPAH